MTDFSEAYDSITDQINTFVSAQISAETVWNNIPGGLDKVSASSMGFAWGIGNGKLYMCQLPCSGGEWKNIPVPGTIVDIVADDTHIYVLGNSAMYSKSASNVDDWITVKAPSATSILASGSYIWAQDGSNKKYKVAKPATTGNWIPIEDALNIKISSASATSLYGTDASGKALKSDETLQTGWIQIPDFAGEKVSKVFGDIDQSALYGLDTTNQLKRCVSGKCEIVPTNGLTPKTITFEPVSKMSFMTTDTPGSVGNVFTKPDSASASGLFSTTAPLDKQRDTVVSSSEQQFQDTTHSSILARQLQKVKDILATIFPKSKKTTQSPTLHKDVVNTTTEIKKLQEMLPQLQLFVYLVLLTASVYMLLGFLGFLKHIVATGVLVSGLYYIYFLRGKQ